MTYHVHFVREDKTVEAKEGSNLLEVLRAAGLHPDAPCAGRGLCGKCRVRLLGQDKIVKACQTVVKEDLQVDTLVREQGHQILTQGTDQEIPFDPELLVVQVSVPPCPVGESVSDWTRFHRALQQELNTREDFSVNLQAASRLYELLGRSQGKVWTVVLGRQVLDILREKPRALGAAFDIGTTTVAGYLLDLDNGAEMAVTSCMNPQAQYGADVINRANYALEKGMEEVTACIRKTINDMLQEMACKAGASTDQIYQVSIAGNTCMHHLFLGIQVGSLVHAPYNPAVEEPMVLRAQDFGIAIHPRGQLFMLPNIAGFVGADTVACLVASALPQQEDWTLLIDIGTNGEMVLGKNHRMITCSTAAGPAFEGAKITCGMRGAAGAVNTVKWKDGGWEFTTIGQEPARGICGSGLLDLAAELLKCGKMDESGELLQEKEIVLADKDHSGTQEPVFLNQRDIRELQLAKAAISAGIHLLAEKMGITLDEITQVWIAGAFGSFLSPESACTIGLLPMEFLGKVKALGNAAGEGAKMVLKSRQLWEKAQVYARETEFLELAALPEFQDCFVDELEFPEVSKVDGYK